MLMPAFTNLEAGIFSLWQAIPRRDPPRISKSPAGREGRLFSEKMDSTPRLRPQALQRPEQLLLLPAN